VRVRIAAETTGRLLVELDDGPDVTYDLARREVKPLWPLTREEVLGPGWRPWCGDAELEAIILARVAAVLPAPMTDDEIREAVGAGENRMRLLMWASHHRRLRWRDVSTLRASLAAG
jgi:hypothetical protein